MTLTAEQRAELRELDAEASPGPWAHDNRAKGTEGDPCLFTESGPHYSPGKSPVFIGSAFWTAADGDLCAEMRNALPALLDAADRADAMVPLLVEALAYLAEHPSEHDPRRAEKAKLCDRIAAVLRSTP